MNSTPPASVVDRIERTANPFVLALSRSLSARGASRRVGSLPHGLGRGDRHCDDRRAGVLRRCSGSCSSPSACCNLPAAPARLDTTKAIADSNPDGLDRHRRRMRAIIYANDAYRALSGAQGRGGPEAGRAAVRRRAGRLRSDLPARAGGPRRQARARGTAHRAAARPARAPSAWYRIRVRPLEGVARDRATLWTVSDDHARARTARELLPGPAARDRLSRPRAGRLSSRPSRDGSIAYMNATLADWLDYDLAQFAAGQLKTRRHRRRRRRRVADSVVSGRPGEVTTEQFDVDLKRRRGRVLPVAAAAPRRLLQRRPARPFAHRWSQPRARRDHGRGDLRAAEVRFARFFNSTPMAIASVDADGRVLRVQRRLRAARARRR